MRSRPNTKTCPACSPPHLVRTPLFLCCCALLWLGGGGGGGGGGHRQASATYLCPRARVVDRIARSLLLPSSLPAGTHRSTVGLVVTGTIIDHLITGSPAHLSDRLAPGDVIKEIDTVYVTPANLVELLIGPDVPGTLGMVVRTLCIEQLRLGWSRLG